MAIGAVAPGFSPVLQLGTDGDSFAYANGGHKLACNWTAQGSGVAYATAVAPPAALSSDNYGESFGEGDTVGCCMLPGTGSIFFTKNGARLREWRLREQRQRRHRTHTSLQHACAS